MNARDALIRLNMIRGLGAATIHRLLEAFGSAEAVFRLDPEQLKLLWGRYATQEVLAEIREAADGKALAQELRWAEKEKVRIVTLLDSDYPELLKQIHSPPPVLYLRGTLIPTDAAAVAIVGTRSATPYGLAQARRFGEDLVRCGITVVSGLAEGIDAAGHEGALSAGGRTIAVVGHGLSTIFPSRHRPLAERVAQSGCLLSEFPMGMPPNKENFPRRNRVISGLSLGVLVVEAPVRSGALITAREAMEQGREVFAVPGPVSSRQSQGTHELIKDGAKLVCEVQDILEELAPQLREMIRPSTDSVRPELAEGRTEETQFPFGLSDEESEVFEAVPVGNGTSLDEIARDTTLQPARLMSLLTSLELKGLVKQEPGRGFSRPS